jgi:hypothetical protein
MDDGVTAVPSQLAVNERVAEQLLKSARITVDIGRQVALVAPMNQATCSAIVREIFRATGFWPYLVQTKESRKASANPEQLRVLDVDGMIRG